MRQHMYGPHRGKHPHPRRSRGNHGFGREFGPDFGPEFAGGFGPRRGRGRGRRGRGDVRAAALLLLDEQARHGYDLIQEIGERSEASWTPSPGSIYPVLQQLEDEGLIEFERVDGRKTASLTDEGRAFVEENREQLGTPWEQPAGGRPEEVKNLMRTFRGTVDAVRQVAAQGTPEQQVEATAVLDDARKALYRILSR